MKLEQIPPKPRRIATKEPKKRKEIEGLSLSSLRSFVARNCVGGRKCSTFVAQVAAKVGF
jgi:hypothetical protein